MNKDFMSYVMGIDPKHKMPKNFNPAIEKYILRKAFDNPDDPYCPAEILWR
jgi:asparagine synthase (glutamine-hydrolysing)